MEQFYNQLNYQRIYLISNLMNVILSSDEKKNNFCPTTRTKVIRDCKVSIVLSLFRTIHDMTYLTYCRVPSQFTVCDASAYKKCQEKPLSLQILKARWNLFGHILRRDSDIPVNRATRAYFIQYGHKIRGRPTTTLPIVLNRDLGLIDHFRLHSTDDLVKITDP